MTAATPLRYPGGVPVPALVLPTPKQALHLPRVDWSNVWLRIKAPIAAYLRDRFFALSKLDGKPGFTMGDFSVIVNWCLTVSSAAASSAAKAGAVEAAVCLAFPWCTPWMATLLVSLAYQFAKRMGYVKS